MSGIRMTPEQSVALSSQLMRAVRTEASIQCLGTFPLDDAKEGRSDRCREVPLWKAYRCFYCGFFFCPECAPHHFENAQAREGLAARDEAIVKPWREAVERAEELVQCDCSIPMRDSGHAVGCWMPETLDAFRALLNRKEAE